MSTKACFWHLWYVNVSSKMCRTTVWLKFTSLWIGKRKDRQRRSNEEKIEKEENEFWVKMRKRGKNCCWRRKIVKKIKVRIKRMEEAVEARWGVVRVVIMNRSAVPGTATNKANSLNWQKQRKLVQLLKEGSKAPNLKNVCMTNKQTNKKKNNKCKRYSVHQGFVKILIMVVWL